MIREAFGFVVALVVAGIHLAVVSSILVLSFEPLQFFSITSLREDYFWRPVKTRTP